MRVCPRCAARYSGGEVCPKDGATLMEPNRDPLIGATLGDYQPIELVGSGGMALVYRARHVSRSGRFALKVLTGPAGEDVVSRERFVREVRAIQQINHPNVVGLVDWGTTPSGRRYLVMEWVEGRELSDAIRAEAPFHPRRAAAIARQIADGLDAIHRAGFIHRDVKPHNVMLFEGSASLGSEAVKIVDFGLVYADANLWNRLTRAGDIVGTPFYMAPETIEGAEADARTDLYSLGVILYEMLAGQVPFASPSIPEILAKHLKELPGELPDVGGLETLAFDLLAKSPAKRPQTAEEVIERIDALDLTLTLTSPGRAPSLLTMVTEPGVRRDSLSVRMDTVDPATDHEPDNTAPTRAGVDEQFQRPQPATLVVPVAPLPDSASDTLHDTTVGPPTPTAEDDEDATAAMPADAPTFVGMAREDTGESFDAATPQIPLSARPPLPSPPVVTVGPAPTAAARIVIAKEPPRDGARDHARDLGQPLRETTRENVRDPARDPARDHAREVKIDISPPRRGLGRSPALVVVGTVVLGSIALGITLAHLMKSDREPKMVQVKLPTDNRPRAIARAPVDEPAEDPSPTKAGSRAREAAKARDPGAASTAGAPAIATGAMPDVDRELRRIAEQHGFEIDELRDVPAAATPHAALVEAMAKGDRERARDALAALEAALAGQEPDVAFLRRRSESLGALLREARDRVPTDRLRTLEARHEELAKRIDARPDPTEVRALALALRKLRADVAKPPP